MGGVILDTDIEVTSSSKISRTSIKDRILLWQKGKGDLAGQSGEFTQNRARMLVQKMVEGPQYSDKFSKEVAAFCYLLL